MEYILAYIAAINAAAYIMMGVDKRKAQRGSFRISERNLFIVALLGGGAGALLGMKVFRHKTKHLKFTLGMPVMVLLNIIVFGFVIYKFFMS